MIAFKPLDAVSATSTFDANDPLQPAWSALRSFYAELGWGMEDSVMLVPDGASTERSVMDLIEQSVPLVRDGEGKIEAVEALSRLARDLNQRGASADILRKVLPSWVLDCSPDACVHFAHALAREGRDHDVYALMRQALGMDSAHGAAHRELGLGFRRLEQLEEAGTHLETATALRRRAWFHTVSELDSPVQVAQIGLDVEIYIYGSEFYVYLRHPDSIGVRAIAGEAFDIRKSAGFYFAHALMRVRWMHQFFRWLANRRFVRTHMSQSTVVGGPGLMRHLGDRARNLIRLFVRALALKLFARQIDRRAATFAMAMELAAECVPEGVHGR